MLQTVSILIRLHIGTVCTYCIIGVIITLYYNNYTIIITLLDVIIITDLCIGSYSYRLLHKNLQNLCLKIKIFEK